jgi:hypothetical protein
MRQSERVELLGGPYRAPALRVGARATCLYRDCMVIITSWTDARISWPRCRPVDVARSHPTLLVDDELARAIRTESAAALRYWWGVGVKQVWRWRQCYSIGRTRTPGSARLVQAAAQLGADAMKEREWTEEEREQRRRETIASGRNANVKPGYNRGPLWSAEQLALLGAIPDEEVAAQVGRTVGAVRAKRNLLGIVIAKDRRQTRD